MGLVNQVEFRPLRNVSSLRNPVVLITCECLTRLPCLSTSTIMATILRREDVLCTIAAHPCSWVPLEGF